MDKEIKFRQALWDKHNKFSGWHYWGFMPDLSFVGPDTSQGIATARQNSCQFINQKDKDDKKIYEGDIVKELDGRISVIMFDIFRACFRAEEKVGFSEFISDNCEIIGNSTTSEKHELMK